MIRLAKAEEVRTWNFLANFRKDSKVWADNPNRDYVIRRFEGMIRSGDGAVLLSENEEGKIMGGLGVIKAPDLFDGIFMAVETFWFVFPEYRKLGVGVDLLEAFEQWGRGNGCRKAAMIHLVDSYPEVLKTFYESRGYKLIELHYVKALS